MNPIYELNFIPKLFTYALLPPTPENIIRGTNKGADKANAALGLGAAADNKDPLNLKFYKISLNISYENIALTESGRCLSN